MRYPRSTLFINIILRISAEGEEMTLRSVYVIWTNPLFFETARLMLKHPSLQWLGSAQDIKTAREEILKLHPDTILFERTGIDVPTALLEIMEEVSRDIRIITLSLGDNEISLLRREQQTVAAADDLLQYVLG